MTPRTGLATDDAGSRARWGLEGVSVGLALGGIANNLDWRRHLALAQQADRAGLHSLWLPEMHFAPGACSTPLSCLSALAAATDRVRLGTTSLLLPIHDPVRTARDVRALENLSNHRLLLGLGRGFRKPLFDAFGIPAREKRDRFDAHLEVMLREWQGHPPPMSVAAFGRKGLEQAARHGLPYLASPIESLELVQENLAFHRQHLPPDVDPGSLAVPIMRTVFVSNDDREASRVFGAMEREARAMLRGPVPEALGRAAQAPLEDRVLIGSVQRVVDDLARYRERVGLDLLIARIEVPGALPAQREKSFAHLIEDVAPALG